MIILNSMVVVYNFIIANMCIYIYYTLDSEKVYRTLLTIHYIVGVV